MSGIGKVVLSGVVVAVAVGVVLLALAINEDNESPTKSVSGVFWGVAPNSHGAFATLGGRW